MQNPDYGVVHGFLPIVTDSHAIRSQQLRAPVEFTSCHQWRT
jgi:hypothetical protein